MVQQILSKYTKTQSSEGAATDSRQPYSFFEWSKKNVGIIPGKERTQYDQYLLKWYEDRDSDIVDATATVRADYIALLKQLSIAFRTDAEKELAVDINWDDIHEVEQIIPFYAKKLKEVAIYIINKREAVKKAKLKYNLVGSDSGLEALFYEYILKAFTKRSLTSSEHITNVLEPSTLNIIPELSAINAKFDVRVQELYDDTSYFDLDPSKQINTYFDVSGATIVDYLTGKGFDTTDVEWLYQTGVTQLCADNPLMWSVDNIIDQYQNGTPLSALESTDSTVLNDYNRIALSKKYLGTDQYFVSGGYYTPWSQNIQFDFAKGNNWFYWLSGDQIDNNDTTLDINAINLTATDLNDYGTAGDNSSTSSWRYYFLISISWIWCKWFPR